MLGCDGYYFNDDEINGTCPDCGAPTCDGHAEACYYSPTECKTCGYSPCDESC